MSYTYTSNIRQVNSIVDRAASLAVRNMLGATHKEAQPNTPKDTGDLKDNVVIQVLGTAGTITWMQDYAIYQEKNQHANYTTAGTGPHFALNAVKAVTKNSNKYFHDAFRNAPKTSAVRGLNAGTVHQGVA